MSAAPGAGARTHLLDDLWLLTIATLLLAIGAPWLQGSLHLDLSATLVSLLALALIQTACTTLIGGAADLTGWKRRALTLLHLLGVLAIGEVWQASGALENPMLLGLLVVPVIGAVFLSRWLPYLTALVAVGVVALIGLVQSPELRWQVGALGAPVRWLASQLGGASTYGTSFAGFYAPGSYFLVLLEVFAIVMVAAAFAAEYLGSLIERLLGTIRAADAAAARAQAVWHSLIERSALPALLVDTETRRIVCASAGVGELCGAEEVLDKPLLTVLRPSFPELLEELVRGADGSAEQLVLNAPAGMRTVTVHARHLVADERRLALLLIEDTTTAFALRAALESSEQALLVLDGADRVLAFNTHALALFAGTRIGADASALLARLGTDGRWWAPGLGGRRKLHVQVLPQVLQVTSTAVRVPGEDAEIFVLAFTPVGRAAGSGSAGVAGRRALQ